MQFKFSAEAEMWRNEEGRVTNYAWSLAAHSEPYDNVTLLSFETFKTATPAYLKSGKYAMLELEI